MRQPSLGSVFGAVGVVASAVMVRKFCKSSRKDRRNKATGSGAAGCVPPTNASQRQTETIIPQEEALVASMQPLMTVESIKLDGRLVLCVDVEAASDEVTPAAADNASTAVLRLLDLLLALAVLLICLVAGDLDVDVASAGMLLFAVLAASAVVGLKEHCAEQLGSSTLHIAKDYKAAAAAVDGMKERAQVKKHLSNVDIMNQVPPRRWWP